jgi:peptidoglycan-associated lipoprotein
MNRPTQTASALTGVLCLLVLAGCPKKAVVTPAPQPEPENVVQAPSAEFTWRLANIYFDFDRSDIRTHDAMVLEDNGEQIHSAAAEDQTPGITIEGYCDPIGTAEYNIALGMRRAEAARAYLVRLGVEAGQLSTISYGEEKLVTQDPALFELNRRCEFKVAR